MSMHYEVKGIFGAMMTPFDEKGSVSREKTIKLMEFFLEKKVDGVFPVSNVGEFAALTFEEKCEIIKTCTTMGAGKIQVWPGVTDLNLDRAILLAEYAGEWGADGVILSSPYYYPYGKSYIEEYMRIFVEKSPLPVIIYHSPRFSNPIEEEFLFQLIHHPKVAAVKESSGDVRFLLSLLERIKREGLKTSVMVGWEELLLTGLVHGADGCIVSCAGIVPEILREIYGCFMKNDMEMAARHQQSICRITEALGAGGLPYGYKQGAAVRVPMQILQSGRMGEMEQKLQEELTEIKELLDRELSYLKQ